MITEESLIAIKHIILNTKKLNTKYIIKKKKTNFTSCPEQIFHYKIKKKKY